MLAQADDGGEDAHRDEYAQTAPPLTWRDGAPYGRYLEVPGPEDALELREGARELEEEDDEEDVLRRGGGGAGP